MKTIRPLTDQERDLVREFAGGLTCSRMVRCQALRSYVLVHHRSHKDWAGGFTGSVTCEAYHALFTMEAARDPASIGAKRGAILLGRMREATFVREGRMRREDWAEVERITGVQVPEQERTGWSG